MLPVRGEPMNRIELGPADNRRHIPVALADALVVRLPESGAAGYGWDVAIAGPADVTDDRIEQPAGPVAGAALVRRLDLAAQDRGQVILRAIRHNPWDDTVEEYTVALDVT
jgi:hypothetical protein